MSSCGLFLGIFPNPTLGIFANFYSRLPSVLLVFVRGRLGIFLFPARFGNFRQ